MTIDHEVSSMTKDDKEEFPMNIEGLLADPPVIHGEGTSSTHHLETDIVRYMSEILQEGMKTLETGIGVSTAVFAIKGCRHICIAPKEQEVRDFTTYCQQHRISVKDLNFQIHPSERVLPLLHAENLDVVLIDGNHAFPIPFLDYFYTSTMLRTGGFLVIDDVHLWTGKILKDFLLTESEWQFVTGFYDRAVVFQKISEVDPRKWHGQQPYVMQKSQWLIRKSQLIQALHLVKNGEFSYLAGKIKKSVSEKRAR